MQSILNKALKFIHCNEQDPLTVSVLHIKYITPLNIANYYKAQNTWETIKISENLQYEELTTIYNNTHKWFPKSSNIVRMETPQAIIT